MYLYLYCRTVKDLNFKMHPPEEFDRLVGHRSVYGFNKGDSIIIQNIGRRKGLKQFTPFADTLMVDFDDQPAAAEELYNFLKASNITFYLFDSGNRSYHFHIPHNPLHDKRLPYTHYKWLLGVEGITDHLSRALFDKNLYRPSSLFRLPNTMHPKTSRRKEMLDMHEGATLHLELVNPPIQKTSQVEAKAEFENLLDQLLWKYLKGAATGEKYNTLFCLGVTCAEVGLSEETAVEMCSFVNNAFENPKNNEELRRAVIDGYKYNEGKNDNG